MLRITTHDTDDGLVIALEGRLSGAWVLEAHRAWRHATARNARRRIRVDMTGICHVDEGGRRLMTLMHLRGAEFVTAGCEMPEIVREISEGSMAVPGLVRRS